MNWKKYEERFELMNNGCFLQRLAEHYKNNIGNPLKSSETAVELNVDICKIAAARRALAGGHGFVFNMTNGKRFELVDVTGVQSDEYLEAVKKQGEKGIKERAKKRDDRLVSQFEKASKKIVSDETMKVAKVLFDNRHHGVTMLDLKILTGCKNASHTRRYLEDQYGFAFRATKGKYYLEVITLMKSKRIQKRIKRQCEREKAARDSVLAPKPFLPAEVEMMLNSVFS